MCFIILSVLRFWKTFSFFILFSLYWSNRKHFGQHLFLKCSIHKVGLDCYTQKIVLSTNNNTYAAHALLSLYYTVCMYFFGLISIPKFPKCFCFLNYLLLPFLACCTLLFLFSSSSKSLLHHTWCQTGPCTCKGWRMFLSSVPSPVFLSLILYENQGTSRWNRGYIENKCCMKHPLVVNNKKKEI